MNLTQLQRDLDAKRTEGLALIDSTAATCKTEDRLMTAEERGAIEAIASTGRELQAKVDRAKGDQEMFDQIARLGGAAGRPSRGGPGQPARYQTMGEQFVTAAEYEFFRKGHHRTGSAWRSPSLELLAATLTEDPASGGALVVPTYVPGIVATPTRQLVVADLLAPGTTDSNMVTYFREKTWTNAAAPVLEGAAKPESVLTFEAATAPVRKIATWLPTSEEMLEDVPQIKSYIDARLTLGVGLAEEAQLLNGDGVAPNILGLRVQPGMAVDVVRAAAEPNSDAILRQIMAIFGTSFVMPDGIAIHPGDWATTLLTKGSTGQYYTQGPFAPIQAPTLWGLPTAITPAITLGVALVGAYKFAAQLFRKGGIRVEASNSHQDFFVKNLVAIRAEERLALACYRPSAFGEVTGLGPVVP